VSLIRDPAVSKAIQDLSRRVLLPKAPNKLAEFSEYADLPSAERYRACAAFVNGVMVVSDGSAWKTAGPAPLELFGGQTSAAVQKAWEARIPFFYPSRSTLTITMDFSDIVGEGPTQRQARWQRLKDYLDWYGTRSGGGPVKLCFPEGMTTIEGVSLTWTAEQGELYWGAASGATSRVVKNITYTSLGSGRWRALVEMTAAFSVHSTWSKSITAISRLSNVVTATIGAHDLVVGDAVSVTGVSGFTGNFQITAVTATTVSWAQTGTDGSGSALGTMTRARVRVGYVLGLQNMYGDNHARALNGAIIVTKVGAARTTFEGEFWFTKAVDGVMETLTNPTVDTGVDSSTSDNNVARSRVQVPFACVVSNGGFNGTTTEGAFCFRDGGYARQEYLGVGYWPPVDTPPANPANGNGCTIFIKDKGSRYELVNDDVICGGPERVIRIGDEGNLTALNACIGGGAAGQEVLVLQAGASTRLVRTSLGMAFDEVVASLDDCYVNIDQCFIASGSSGVEASGSIAILKGTRISFCTRGAYATAGAQMFHNVNTKIWNCAVSLDVLSAYHFGAVTLGTGTEANGSDMTPNEYQDGGAWIDVPGTDVIDKGAVFSPEASGIDEAQLTGTSGRVEVLGTTDLAMACTFDVLNGTTPSVSAVFTGTNAAVNALENAVGVDGTGTKCTWSVYHKTHTITAAERTDDVITFTTSATHGIGISDTVVVSGMTDPSFDGEFTIEETPSATTFTVQQDGDDEPTGGTGSVDAGNYLRAVNDSAGPHGKFFQVHLRSGLRLGIVHPV